MKRPREWEWIPDLLVCYLVLGAAWCGAGVAVFSTMEHRAGSRVDALLFSTLQVVLWLVVLGGPVAAVAATVRVILNELRWRRQGDPRGW